ncbi:TIP41-like type 2a phosphatase regulator Tip41 [Schizosaccharomyces cryophilus OY26]|uniref:TIP41-like type 2a phosphatase regulator Tip41 n=1 Tax=Schizosaccharomyces cryophilus (strain OY26 / ATCC MYA-4695 / CBS 11777 / NBRC 106824 / NRRL Y48691) TaxID=653667 RepID=S9VWF1_SCHCR|nr:TIP41-like type 2a phosphatase regulator Tip41 [Schizosaccharomyces cryophilus OY26]EPY50574.1 TIP41-like type 2a phosphatase regulator Tip41 [Schizosaccharomyces cryophilus OY26]
MDPKIEEFSYGFWKIKAQRGAILKSFEVDNLQTELGFAPPEMTFGKNFISIYYKDSPIYGFFTKDALETVGKGPGELMQVSFAGDWIKSRSKTGESFPVVSPYDWTYYTEYQGTLLDRKRHFEEIRDHIPARKILEAGTNLWYNELILFEDELADNGKAMFDVRVRVVKGHLILLARLVMRLDNVIVRVNETRIYIDLDGKRIMKDFRKKESNYESVIKRIPLGSDKARLLDDNNWLSESLPLLYHKVSELQDAL